MFEQVDVLAYEPAAAVAVAFDFVIVFYLQLPAAERAQALSAAARALAPGGTLLVVGHDLINRTIGSGGPKDPAVLFTPADVVGDACAGLTVEKAERVGRPVETATGRRWAIDALVRARRPVEA